MRTPITSAVAVAAVLLVGTTGEATAVTLGDARWQGTFDVTQTLVRDTLNADEVGLTSTRVHTVTSSCAGTQACSTVRFKRVAGDGVTTFAYRLNRVEPGKYQGSTSYEASWWCTINGQCAYTWTGPLKETTTLVARAVNSTRVTRYRGTLRLLYTPYEIDGSVPQKCQDHFASLGLQEGDRPVVKLSLLGRLR